MAFTTPAGGRIAIPPEGEVVARGPILQTERGVAFGPVALGPAGGGTVGLSRLSYLPAATGAGGDAVGGGLAAGAFAGGAVADGRRPPGEEPPGTTGDLSRREYLALGAVALAGAGGAAAATGGLKSAALAELEVVRNQQGFGLGLLDGVEEVLPTGTSHAVVHEGRRVGTVADGNPVAIPAGATGRFALHVEGAGDGGAGRTGVSTGN